MKLTEKDASRVAEIKQTAQKWLSEQLKEKGVDPDSLVFDLDARDVIPLDQDHTCVVLSVRPKGFVHVPVKGKEYDPGHVTLVTRETIGGETKWIDRYVDKLCAELIDPKSWTPEQK